MSSALAVELLQSCTKVSTIFRPSSTVYNDFWMAHIWLSIKLVDDIFKVSWYVEFEFASLIVRKINLRS